jgi:adenylate cyclase
MGTEIERKFLVDVARLPREALREGSRFVQGYLSLSPTVRVRVSERPGLPTEAWITVKGPGGLMRAEYEYAIPVDDARAMVLLCVASLRKTRFRVLVGDHVWDLDQYHDRYEGLWIAEIELDEPDEDFTRPPWITEEVTDDPRTPTRPSRSARSRRPPADPTVLPVGRSVRRSRVHPRA